MKICIHFRYVDEPLEVRTTADQIWTDIITQYRYCTQSNDKIFNIMTVKGAIAFNIEDVLYIELQKEL